MWKQLGFSGLDTISTHYLGCLIFFFTNIMSGPCRGSSQRRGRTCTVARSPRSTRPSPWCTWVACRTCRRSPLERASAALWRRAPSESWSGSWRRARQQVFYFQELWPWQQVLLRWGGAWARFLVLMMLVNSFPRAIHTDTEPLSLLCRSLSSWRNHET